MEHGKGLSDLGTTALGLGVVTGALALVPTPATPVLASASGASFSIAVSAKYASTLSYLGASITKSLAAVGDYFLEGQVSESYWNDQMKIGEEVIESYFLERIFKVGGRPPTTWVYATKNKASQIIQEIISRGIDLFSLPEIDAQPCEISVDPSCFKNGEPYRNEYVLGASIDSGEKNHGSSI